MFESNLNEKLISRSCINHDNDNFTNCRLATKPSEENDEPIKTEQCDKMPTGVPVYGKMKTNARFPNDVYFSGLTKAQLATISG